MERSLNPFTARKQSRQTEKLYACKLARQVTAACLLLSTSALAQQPSQPANQWSPAPFFEKSAIGSLTDAGEIAPFTIEPPKIGLPPVNPELEVASPADLAQWGIRGTITYVPRLQVGAPHAQQYWVFHLLGESKNLDGQPAPIVTYHGDYTSTYRFYDPQLSPDGRKMLVKQAQYWSESWGSYFVLLWDLERNTIKRMQAPNGLQYRRVLWSPNSQFIAFVSGGDQDGGVDSAADGTPNIPVLHIYNVQDGKEHIVTTNPQVSRMAWTDRNTLLFTMEEADNKKNKPTKDNKNKETDEEVPDKTLPLAIYEVNPQEGSVPTKIIPNGFFPRPSPDGKWIAYAAESRPKKKGEKLGGEDGQDVPAAGIVINDRISRGVGLYLWNRQTQKRTLIGTADLNWLGWTPDSQHLVALYETYKTIGTGNNVTGQGQETVRMVDVPSLKSRAVTTLKANDYYPAPGSDIWPQFDSQISNDGRLLFVKQREFIAEEAGYQTEHKTLLALDLTSGKTLVMARLLSKYTNIISWDFHDDSPLKPSSLKQSP